LEVVGMTKNQIVAQLYSVKKYTQTPEDVEKTLNRIRSIGYNAVQVSGFGPIDPKYLKELADKAGVKIVATHISYDRLLNDFDALVKDHKTWECEYVGIGGMPSKYRKSKEGFITFAKEASEIGKRLAENGLNFIYHNHYFEFQKFDGVLGYEVLLNESDPRYFGFEIDTYWLHTGGASIVDWIKKVKGRMDVIHLKDMIIKNDEQTDAAIGEGNFNWKKILKTCKETGVKWYCVNNIGFVCNFHWEKNFHFNNFV
jgi:sugar phosphate isomerase/epimerase